MTKDELLTVEDALLSSMEEIERLRGREAMLRGLAANDGNPDQHVARRALALMDNITELFHRANGE